MQQQVESDREGVKSFLEAGAGVALIPGLAPSRRGHHMPPLKKKADVAIGVKFTSEGPETCGTTEVCSGN